MYKGKPIKIIANFSTETLKARFLAFTLEWDIQGTEWTYFSPRILYPEKLSVKIGREIKFFQNKQKLKQYMTTKPPLSVDSTKNSTHRWKQTKPQENGKY
jgi:hypothetical protein